MIKESLGIATITVINKKRSDGLVRVATVDGIAQAGTDYVAVNHVLMFEFGQAEITFDVNIIDDEGYEEQERL